MASSSSSKASTSKTPMTKKLISLKTFEGDVFQVDPRAATQSQTIKTMISEGNGDTEFPIPNVKSRILEIILVYCNRHANDRLTKKQIEEGRMKEDLSGWDEEYITQFSTNMLYHLLLAANYLETRGLLKLIINRVANLMKGKLPEQIRETFGIKNDFPPGMEEEIRNENLWAFEITEMDRTAEMKLQEKMAKMEIEAKQNPETEAEAAAAPSEATAATEE